jgi:hypothetical protein
MQNISWVDAFLLLNRWETEGSDVVFMKVSAAEVRGEKGSFAHGSGTRVIAASPESGEVKLEVEGQPMSFDFLGSTFRYGDQRESPFVEDLPERHPCSLEVTFPDGEVWVFDEAEPLDSNGH